MIGYLRQHHVAFLALFLALGGGGAYAAGQLSGGEVVGFDATPTNGSGAAKGTLAKLGGLTLTYRSEREDDARRCRLIAKTKGSGEVHSHVVVKPLGIPPTQSVDGARFSDGGSHDVVLASFDEGSPGVSRQVEGQLTWRASGGKHVVTSIFHVSAESKRCAFQGTLSGS